MISLKFVPKSPINNIPALVQIMTWHQPGNKPLSEPMLVNLVTHICTRPHRGKCAWARALIFDSWMDVLVKVLETETVTTWVGLKLLNFRFMPNALATWAIRVRYLLSNVFEYCLWWYRYLNHPGIPGVTLCFCTSSYTAAAATTCAAAAPGRRFLFTR